MRQVISTTDLPAFGTHHFEIPFDATGRQVDNREGSHGPIQPSGGRATVVDFDIATHPLEARRRQSAAGARVSGAPTDIRARRNCLS